jgi:hypothetical protein
MVVTSWTIRQLVHHRFTNHMFGPDVGPMMIDCLIILEDRLSAGPLTTHKAYGQIQALLVHCSAMNNKGGYTLGQSIVDPIIRSQ